MHTFSAGRSGSHCGGFLTVVRASCPSYHMSLPTDPSGSVEAFGVRVKTQYAWLSFINIYLPRGSFADNWFIDSRLPPSLLVLSLASPGL